MQIGRLARLFEARSGQRGRCKMPRMRRSETLLQEALALPDDERAEIAGALLESLGPPPEADVESEWRREVAARVAALEEGGVATTPWEEIRDRFLARLSERNGALNRAPEFSMGDIKDDR
jgi:putative addiction module component (TIGR02574 family)